MKTIFTLPKILSLLMLAFLISTGVSCKDQKSEKNLKDQVDQLEDDENFASSSKRADICQLLTKKDIQEVFGLNGDVKLTQKNSHGAICGYDWTVSNGQSIVYSVSLNFARGKKRTNRQIDAAWKSQNNGVYKKWHPKKISGVGDRASWSDLGGGQLRVAADGYIFYVSHSVMVIQGDKPDDTQGMIDKTSTLAKKVIKKL